MVIIAKTSYQTIFRSLLIAAAVAMIQPSRLAAQQLTPGFAPASLDQPAPAEPVEIAAFTAPASELPEPIPAKSGPEGFAFAPVIGVTDIPKPSHRFWDRENRTLFAVAGGLAVADFCVTRANLASGGKELNPVTRIFSGSTPGLAANFALETGGLVSVSYLLHRTGHHKLERIASYVNISGSAGAVAWSMSHR